MSLGGLLCVALTIPVWATSQAPASGPHWPLRSVIRVWVDPQNLPPQGTQLVDRAMQRWTAAAGGAFSLQQSLTRPQGGIRVYFNGAGGNYGETRTNIDPTSGLINDADVAIAAAAPIATDDMTRQIIVYLTALHEIGHALGMRHTANFEDIMYSFREPDDGERYFGNYRRLLRSVNDVGTATATGLSAYDIGALRALYAPK